MDMFAAMSSGLANILHWDQLLIMIFGTWFGIIVGVIPGLNSIMAVALIVPVTYGLSTITSLSLLISVYVGALTGDSFQPSCSAFLEPPPRWPPCSTAFPWPRKARRDGPSASPPLPPSSAASSATSACCSWLRPSPTLLSS